MVINLRRAEKKVLNYKLYILEDIITISKRFLINQGTNFFVYEKQQKIVEDEVGFLDMITRETLESLK